MSSDFQELELLSDSSTEEHFQPESVTEPPLLPRSAWNNHAAYLRVLFKVKKALDRYNDD
jgi:hypothetical protein